MNFFKDHVLGIFVLSVAASVAGAIVYNLLFSDAPVNASQQSKSFYGISGKHTDRPPAGAPLSLSPDDPLPPASDLPADKK